DHDARWRALHQCQGRRRRDRCACRSAVSFHRLMAVIAARQIAAIIERHAALQARMATGDMAPADFVAASKEFSELEPVAGAAREVVRLRGELDSLKEMLADPEMKAMAAEEIAAVEEALPAAEHDLAIKLLP